MALSIYLYRPFKWTRKVYRNVKHYRQIKFKSMLTNVFYTVKPPCHFSFSDQWARPQYQHDYKFNTIELFNGLMMIQGPIRTMKYRNL